MSSAITAGAGVLSDAAAAGSKQSMQGLASEDFLKIMLAELTNQDPLEPMKNQDLLSQIASIRALETDAGITEALRELRISQQLGSAGGMIGRQVSGLTASGAPAGGVVDRVRLVNGEVFVRLADGTEIPFESVLEIAAAEDGAATNSDGGAV